MLALKVITSKIRRKLLSKINAPKLPSLRKYYGETNYTFTLPDSSKFLYPLNSVIGEALFTGGFELGEVEFIRQILKPGDVFFDIGANGGLYSVLASKIVGNNGHVFACEPGKKELELLRQNVSINQIDNVTIVEAAISNKEGLDRFAVSTDGALSSLKKTSHPDQDIESWQTVKVNTIDNLIQELNVEKIDVLKVDVEGAEKLVFEGADKFLKSNSNVTILFESTALNSTDFGYQPKELISDLMTKGFEVKYIDRLGILKNISASHVSFDKDIYNFIAQKTKK